MDFNLKISREETLRIKLLFWSLTLFFIIRIFHSSFELWLFDLLHELLFFLTVTAVLIYSLGATEGRKFKPLSMVVTVGILNLANLLLVSYAENIFNWLMPELKLKISESDFIVRLSVYFYGLLLLFSSAFIFVGLRYLYYLRQNKNLNIYFNTMSIFIVLTSLTTYLQGYNELKFIRISLATVTTILIIANSLRISWIAFLTKKEKHTLLGLSIIVFVFFVVNSSYLNDEGLFKSILNLFSPVLSELMNWVMIFGALYFIVLFFTVLFHLPTAEAFDRKSREVSSLQYFSKLITGVMDFSELTETITETCLKLGNAEAAWIIWFKDEKKESLALNNIGYSDADVITNYLIDEKKLTASISFVENNLGELSTIKKLSKPYSNIGILPLKTHKALMGYLAIAKTGENYFDEEDKNAISTFSEYASLALENSKLFKDSLEKERIEKELDVAREIQRKILPEVNPENKLLQITTSFIPAFEVGGDYYDFFELSKDEIIVVIADVSGKGISAAFIMAEIKGIFKSLSKTIKQPREILIRANEILHSSLDKNIFVSASVGLINLKDNTLLFSRAGHCSLIILSDNKANEYKPKGMGLGLNFSDKFSNSLEQIKIYLKNDDLLVFYTDGITEAKNFDFDDYGINRLKNVLLKSSNICTDEVSSNIMKDIHLFTNGQMQYDDITLVLIKIKNYK